MHRLVPGSFQGSLVAGGGRARARKIDVACSLMAVMAVAGVWLSAYGGESAPDIVMVLKVSCCVLLAMVAPGLWLIESTAEMPCLGVGRVAARVRQRVRAHDGLGMSPLVPEEAYHGIAGLVGDVILRLRRQPGGRGVLAAGLAADGALDEAASAHQALERGRTQARALAFSLIEEAATLGETAAALEAATQSLTAEADQTQAAVTLTDGAIAAVTSQAVGLARAMRATTARVTEATDIAVAAADMAHGTQHVLAGLDDKSAALLVAAAGIGALLREAGDEAAAPMAGAVLAALDGFDTTVRELHAASAAAVARLSELDAHIQAQHALGTALGHAVMQQGEDVAAILARLMDAQSGFAVLRAGVEAVTRAGAARGANAATLRAAADRLPKHAENIAALMRALPDFAPHMDF